MEKQMLEVQKNEMEEQINQFNENYLKIIKPSVQLLNLNKVLENCIKQKE